MKTTVLVLILVLISVLELVLIIMLLNICINEYMLGWAVQVISNFATNPHS
ncbi:MAG: hypothetical protein ABIU11_05215 [Chitinophagaceae bacterium]